MHNMFSITPKTPYTVNMVLSSFIDKLFVVIDDHMVLDMDLERSAAENDSTTLV